MYGDIATELEDELLETGDEAYLLSEIGELNVRLEHRYQTDSHDNQYLGPDMAEEVAVMEAELYTDEGIDKARPQQQLPDDIDTDMIYAQAALEGGLPLRVKRGELFGDNTMLPAHLRDKIEYSSLPAHLDDGNLPDDTAITQLPGTDLYIEVYQPEDELRIDEGEAVDETEDIVIEDMML